MADRNAQGKYVEELAVEPAELQTARRNSLEAGVEPVSPATAQLAPRPAGARQIVEIGTASASARSGCSSAPDAFLTSIDIGPTSSRRASHSPRRASRPRGLPHLGRREHGPAHERRHLRPGPRRRRPGLGIVIEHAASRARAGSMRRARNGRVVDRRVVTTSPRPTAHHRGRRVDAVAARWPNGTGCCCSPGGTRPGSASAVTTAAAS